MTAFPSLFYGWAAKNSRPRVYWARNQTRKRLTGLLALDLSTGEETLAITPDGKSDMVAWFLHQLVQDAHAEGYTRLTILLDNNATHHDLMRYLLWLRVRSQPELQAFPVDFFYTPAYSPDYNPAEYLIHLIRLKLLHHLPTGTALAAVAHKLEQRFTEATSFLTPQQVANVLRHIIHLQPNSPSLRLAVKEICQV